MPDGSISVPRPIRFRFAPEKAFAALHLIIHECSNADLHLALKTCYFADKIHLNLHGRPVFGATYRAMRFGPVPLEIYEMIKGEALWMAELRRTALPWKLDGYSIVHSPDSNEPPDVKVFSKSDLIAFRDALKKCRSMTFDQRTAATHGNDWRAARMGIMRYEDMIDESPEKSALVAELRETGPSLRL